MTAVDERVLVTAPGVYHLSDDDYFADPVPGGSLSSSGARRLLPPSCPALFKYEQDNPRPPKREFDLGHAAHKLVLGAGPDIVEVEANDWRTNAAKAQRDEIRAAGGVPLLTADYQTVHAMADALRRHKIASAVLNPERGAPEETLVWVDSATGSWCRCKLDWLPHRNGRRMVLPDYKTAVSANPEKFGRSAADLGYYQQAAWNLESAKALELAEDPHFVFIVQERTPPYLVTVCELDADALRIGRHRNRKALQIFTECQTNDHWPGYADDSVELVPLPRWFEQQYADVI